MMGRAATIIEGPLATARLCVHHLHAPNADPNAPRVLFLGGSNFDLRLKRSFLDSQLTCRCSVLTFEPRGIGRTERPDGDWIMQDYARDALAVMDTIGWQRAAVVGESFGGMTALHLAALAPNRITSMVIASATAGGPAHRSFDISSFLTLSREEAAAQALCLQDSRNIALREDNPQAFAALLAQRLLFEVSFASPSVDNGGYARLLDARRAHDCRDVLGQITAPTCVLAGRYDRQARPKAQQALCNALPDASFHQFDAGHGVLFAAPDATATALDAIRSATTYRVGT